MIHVDYFNWVISTDINPVRKFHAQWPNQNTEVKIHKVKFNNIINKFIVAGMMEVEIDNELWIAVSCEDC